MSIQAFQDQVLNGDCIKEMSNLPEKSVDLVFADPPYNLQLTRELFRPDNSKVDAVTEGWDKFTDFKSYDDFTFSWISACRRVLKDTGTLWVIGSYHNIFRIGKILQDLGFWILNDVIWIKDNPMPNFRGVRFTNAHETLIWAQKVKGAKYTFNYQSMKSLNDNIQMRSDWYFPLCTGRERIRINGKKVHKTQKPEALLFRILMASTNPEDVILDPFFGTGTTGVMAKKLNRHYIGIEQDPGYVQIASERILSTEPIPLGKLENHQPRRLPRVPFGSLVETGYLQPGQKLIFSKNQEITATILSDGKIESGDLVGSIHSVARELLGGIPANGWELWFIERDGKMVNINTLRKLALKESTDEKA